MLWPGSHRPGNQLDLGRRLVAPHLRRAPPRQVETREPRGRDARCACVLSSEFIVFPSN